MMPKNHFWFVTALALACFAPRAAAQVTSGTAFTVAPGLLVTNQHVIAGCSSVDVIAADGRRTGSIVNADERIDLALLRVNGLKGATARLRSPRNVRLGESVMVFGFPLAGALSSSGNFTSGHVSALRGLKDAAGELQITAPVQPGNSGGPLMDASGLVIGVVQAKLDALRAAIETGDIPQNVNFAISLDVLVNFLAKNKVAFRDGPSSMPSETARVAELAQNFTYRVECRSRSQQVATAQSIQQPRLPPCTTSVESRSWTNCWGTSKFSGDAIYVGEFRNGHTDGGTIASPSGVRVVVEYIDGILTFHKGIITGQGIRTWRDGRKYVGELRDGHPNGKGTLTFPSGDHYVGEWRQGQFDGQGTYTFSNGRRYIGRFKDSRQNGQGTEYFTDGSIARSGIWENGLLIRSQ